MALQAEVQALLVGLTAQLANLPVGSVVAVIVVVMTETLPRLIQSIQVRALKVPGGILASGPVQRSEGSVHTYLIVDVHMIGSKRGSSAQLRPP